MKKIERISPYHSPLTFKLWSFCFIYIYSSVREASSVLSARQSGNVFQFTLQSVPTTTTAERLHPLLCVAVCRRVGGRQHRSGLDSFVQYTGISAVLPKVLFTEHVYLRNFSVESVKGEKRKGWFHREGERKCGGTRDRRNARSCVCVPERGRKKKVQNEKMTPQG